MARIDTSERDLVARAIAGDDEAFARLVAAHRPRVYRLALLRVQDRTNADDVTQMAFIRLFRALDTFRCESSLATWLHRVTINLCRDLARRQQREGRLVSLTAAGDITDRSSIAAPDLRIIALASEKKVRQAVRRLPEDLPELVALRFGADQTYAEVAETLGLPLGTVCTRMQRALRQLAFDLATGERRS